MIYLFFAICKIFIRDIFILQLNDSVEAVKERNKGLERALAFSRQ